MTGEDGAPRADIAAAETPRRLRGLHGYRYGLGRLYGPVSAVVQGHDSGDVFLWIPPEPSPFDDLDNVSVETTQTDTMTFRNRERRVVSEAAMPARRGSPSDGGTFYDTQGRP